MGTYRFYQNGMLVGEAHNVLTTLGRQAIYRHLAQVEAGYARSIGVGIGDSTALATDVALEFEVNRTEIIQSAPDFINDKVVFKARLPQELEAEIREASIWSGFDSAAGTPTFGTLISFTEDEDWDNGTFETDNTRYGGESLRLTATTGLTSEATALDVSYDFSGMLQNQEFKLAVFVADVNCDEVTFHLGTDVSNYYEFSYPTPTSGYQFATFAKKDAVAVGSPDWSSITVIRVGILAGAGTTNVDFDAFRSDLSVSEEDIDIIVSRAVLPQPIIKTDNAPMDIEYTLSVSIT